jgi:type II secretory pathway component GspD/PulD (secretin)
MKAASSLFALILALSASLANAQAPSAGLKPLAPAVQTFYIKHASSQNDLNEILTAVRNMLPPNIKIYSVAGQNAIVLEAPEEQVAVARQLIDSLDLPKKSYHLTYTITEFDGPKRLSSQRLSMHLAAGQAATLKQGSRIPVITSSNDPANPTTQYAYVDVGLLIGATATTMAGGANLKTKVEQSSVASERSSAAIPDPSIRQTSLESISVLVDGKPSVLGSLDVPGTTHHLEIEALLEPLP